MALELINTKVSGQSASSVYNPMRIKRYIDDKLTQHLLRAWVAHREGAERAECTEDYVFPHFFKGAPQWQKPMNNDTHNKAVQECALYLGLTTAEKATRETDR